MFPTIRTFAVKRIITLCFCFAFIGCFSNEDHEDPALNDGESSTTTLASTNTLASTLVDTSDANTETSADTNADNNGNNNVDNDGDPVNTEQGVSVSESQSEPQFVAEFDDLSNYREWTSIDYSIGATHPALDGRHGSDGDRFYRRIFANEAALTLADNASEFPIGAILVNEVSHFENEANTGEGESHVEQGIANYGGLLAMVKRGGDFNPDGGGWEWFVLSNDRTRILHRGAEILDHGCNDCHRSASDVQSDHEEQFDSDEVRGAWGGLDFVFRHPSEHLVEADFFVGYREWSQIDEIATSHPLLAGGAHAGNEPSAVRRVYQKQLYARPITEPQGFPVGTALAKAVYVDDELTGLVGMVKRIGHVDSAQEGNAAQTATWEWFRIDPSTEQILERGTDLGMCATCHQVAMSDAREGRDFVFNHTDAPFVNHSTASTPSTDSDSDSEVPTAAGEDTP